MKEENASAPVDVLAAMVRDATDAQKFRAGNQHAFAHSVRVEYRRDSDNARAAVAELIEQQKRDAQLVAVLLSYLNDNLSEREKGRLGAELMNRDLSDHDARRRAALARVGGAK